MLLRCACPATEVLDHPLTKLVDLQLHEQQESEAMAEALKEEGNKLMLENKPIEAIAKYVRSWGYNHARLMRH
jgi:hypothetical protein